MPGPVPPDWGVPENFITKAQGAIFERGSLKCSDGKLRLPTLRHGPGSELPVWDLMATDELQGGHPPVFKIEDNQTISVLTLGTWSQEAQTVMLNGLRYRLSIQISVQSRDNIAVAVAVI